MSKREAMRAAAEVSAGKPIESYPIRLFSHHMSEIFGLSLNAFHKQEEAGAFLFAEIRPQIGRKSWSRDRVAAHFAGETKGLTAPRALQRAG